MATAKQVLNFARNKLHLTNDPIRIPHTPIWVALSKLNPKTAADWVEKYNNCNRRIREGRIEEYASDMDADEWILTHQGVAFDDEEEMISGQNRSLGVIKSGKTIETLVFLNCPTAERKVIDQVASRTPKDVGYLGHGDNEVSPFMVAVAQSMVRGPNWKNTRRSATANYQLTAGYRDSLNFVLSHLPRRVPGVTIAPVMGAVCRAFYHLRRNNIAQFLKVLANGLTDAPSDNVVLKLRNWLMENPVKGRGGNQSAYSMTEAALYHYSNAEVPSKLKPFDEPVFALPDPKPAKTTK